MAPMPSYLCLWDSKNVNGPRGALMWALLHRFADDGGAFRFSDCYYPLSARSMSRLTLRSCPQRRYRSLEYRYVNDVLNTRKLGWTQLVDRLQVRQGTTRPPGVMPGIYFAAIHTCDLMMQGTYLRLLSLVQLWEVIEGLPRGSSTLRHLNDISCWTQCALNDEHIKPRVEIKSNRSYYVSG